MKNRAAGFVNVQALSKAEQLYNNRNVEVQNLRAWVNSPARAQEFVEEKERVLRGVNSPSVANTVVKRAGSELNIDTPEFAGVDIFSRAKEIKGFNGLRKSTLTGIVKDSADNIIGKQENNIKDSSLPEKNNRGLSKLGIGILSKVIDGKGIDKQTIVDAAKDSLGNRVAKQKLNPGDSSLLATYNNKKNLFDSLKAIDIKQPMVKKITYL